jgi:hypothetical protein
VPKAKTTTKTVPAKAVVKLPSVWELIKKTCLEYITFWRSFTGLLVVYAILYFVLILGLSFSSNVQNSTAHSNALSKAFNSIISVFSTNASSSSTQSNATVLMQFLLFLVASLAFIWTLRKLQSLKKISLRDAYYQGTSALIPTILVTLVLMLTLLPAIGGSAVLAVALQTTTGGLVIFVTGVIAGLLLLLSIYLFAMLWPAFYIINLPTTRPIGALKSAIKATKKHRFVIITRMIILAILILIFLMVIMVPAALVVAAIVPEVAFVLLFIIFGFAHIYLYKLYRSLL